MRLSTSLLLWIAASGLVALGGTAAFTFVRCGQAAQQDHARVVDTARRILSLQATGVRQGAGLAPRFFDWAPVARITKPPGACVLLVDASGNALRRSCSGRPHDLDAAPAAFAALYARLTQVEGPWRHTVAEAPGPITVELHLDPTVAAAHAWTRIGGILLPMLAAISLAGVVVWLALARALRPLDGIVATLEAIGRGDYRPAWLATGCEEFVRLQGSCDRLAAELARVECERSALVQRLVTLQESERESLALELHDEFGQHLSVIRANAAGIRASGSDALVTADAARIERSAGHLMRLVRDRLCSLRPWCSGGSIVDSLRDIAAELGDGGAGRARVDLAMDDLDYLPAPLATAVFRIVQESLTNALRHAAASVITVSARLSGEAVTVSISDDGRGCDLAQVRRGTGMTGIEQRARANGGRAAFLANARGGVTVLATLPIAIEGAAR